MHQIGFGYDCLSQRLTNLLRLVFSELLHEHHFVTGPCHADSDEMAPWIENVVAMIELSRRFRHHALFCSLEHLPGVLEVAFLPGQVLRDRFKNPIKACSVLRCSAGGIDMTEEIRCREEVCVGLRDTG